MLQCEVLTSWIVSLLSIGSEYVLENGSTDLCITSLIYFWCSAGYGKEEIEHRCARTTDNVPLQHFTTDLAPTLCVSTEGMDVKN